MLALGRSDAAGLAHLADRAQAFDEHQRADDAEEHDITEAHKKIDLAQGFQVVEDKYTHRGANQAADQEDNPHSEIDGLSLEMRQEARKGRGDNLVGLGGHGNRRRDADEEQQRRHQKAAAHAEHARQDAHHAAQPEEQEGVYRNFGYRQVYLHAVL